MRLILLSDIHSNLTALNAVIEDFTNKYAIDGIILLGDIINYGMRPNEVIKKLRSLSIPIIGNIFGNHEKSIFDGDTSRFTTERGKQLLEYTQSILTADSIDYIQNNCDNNGYVELNLSNKHILVIHGNMSDPFWGKMTDTEMSDFKYSKFDYVISGHSHIPHLVEKFHGCDAPAYRNKKRTVFINPGSVGQPRNHNPRAQYACLDLETAAINFSCVGYDITIEQSLYPNDLDSFYSTRLEKGI